MIEERLKAISDEMFEAQRVLPGRAELPDDDNRELMGVMRVGALAANTVLAGECEFMMVMMMKEKPTYQMLARIAKGLRIVFLLSIFIDIDFTAMANRQRGAKSAAIACEPIGMGSIPSRSYFLYLELRFGTLKNF